MSQKLNLSTTKILLVKITFFSPEWRFVNNFCIFFHKELIESRNIGIFTLLDEESKLPKPSPTHFTTEVHSAWSSNDRLSFPRTSRLKANRTLRDEEGFLVRHFAGAVCYTTVSFLNLILCFKSFTNS